MSKSKIKSICILVLSLIICFGVLAGCGQKLSSDFDEAEVKSAAENVITLVNEKDSEGLREMSTVQMKEGLTDDLLNKVYEAIGEGGAFKNVEDIRLLNQTLLMMPGIVDTSLFVDILTGMILVNDMGVFKKEKDGEFHSL